ncbi:hypothetical protein [Alkalicoccus urumqiensis]|uniref:Copper amine oxidase-like N-terminal domain-containing protein n=1 Tax=Alkalicoccus urumqiensis TaxID=1548213 RepID=A0A2P6MHN3_ALKUR|nr:hypothetical protein [Alkalicoccus urumqiensis]PRO65786.1 hypothetical protein C6I21_07770 [Alkalicoccus urumqiensis]
MRDFIVGIAAVVLLVVLLPAQGSAEERSLRFVEGESRFYDEGEAVELPAETVVRETPAGEDLFIPLRAFGEHLGYTLNYHSNRDEYEMTGEFVRFHFADGRSEFRSSGPDRKYSLGSYERIGNYLMIPLKETADNLNMHVHENDGEYLVKWREVEDPDLVGTCSTDFYPEDKSGFFPSTVKEWEASFPEPVRALTRLNRDLVPYGTLHCVEEPTE